MENKKTSLLQLAVLLAEHEQISKKEAEIFVKNFFSIVASGITEQNYVKVKNLGVFKLTSIDERESINVNNGERIAIKGHNKITFTPEPQIKKHINKPFEHFEPVILKDSVVVDETSALDTEVVEEQQFYSASNKNCDLVEPDSEGIITDLRTGNTNTEKNELPIADVQPQNTTVSADYSLILFVLLFIIGMLAAFVLVFRYLI